MRCVLGGPTRHVSLECGGTLASCGMDGGGHWPPLGGSRWGHVRTARGALTTRGGPGLRHHNTGGPWPACCCPALPLSAHVLAGVHGQASLLLSCMGSSPGGCVGAQTQEIPSHLQLVRLPALAPGP